MTANPETERRHRFRHWSTLLICLLAPLCAATSCVRFVYVEQSYSPATCADPSKLPENWNGPGFLAKQVKSTPHCRLYRVTFLDKKNHAYAATLLSVQRLHRDGSSCEWTVIDQVPCQTRFSIDQCFARSLNGEPLPPGGGQPSVKTAMALLQSEITKLLVRQGILPTAAQPRSKTIETKKPLSKICDQTR